MEYFYKVAELKSFTKAAKELYVSQPTVTNYIQQLEDKLNVKLLKRNTKTVTLTPEGKIFYEKVKNILQSIYTTIEEVKNKEKTLKLQFTNYIESYKFLNLFSQVDKLFPDIQIKVSENCSAQIVENIVNESTDIGLFIFPEDTSKLHTIPLYEVELVLCTSKYHRFQHKQKINVEEMKDEKIISLPDDFIQHKLMNDLCLKNGFVPNVIYKSSDITTIKAMIKNNMGISFLTDNYLLHEHDIHTISLDPPITLTVGLGWKKDKILTNHTMKFISFLKNFILTHSYYK